MLLNQSILRVFCLYCLTTATLFVFGISLQAQISVTEHTCKTHEIIDIWRTLGERAELQHPEKFQRPREADQNSYQSPSGRFLFWYTLEGEHAIPPADASGSGIPDWVEIAADAADFTWSKLVGELGFADPIPEGGFYEFFFRNLGFYGQTSLSNNTPFSILDATFEWVPGNDFENDAIGALKVTLAHEFYHAIQFTYNQWAGPTGADAWLEMDAVNTEHFVFPQVSEYLNLFGNSSIFQVPSRSTPSAYDHTTWMLFFTERFGHAFFRGVWEKIAAEPEITFPKAIEEHLSAIGGDFHEEMTRLYLWHLASGNWSHPEYGFSHSARYPTSFKRTQRTSVPNQPYPFWNINPLATNFHAILPGQNDTGEILIALFADQPEIGIGILLFLKDGSIVEHILPSVADGNLFHKTGYMWEDVDRVGIGIMNRSETSTRLYQLMAGAGDGIEQIRYGDVNRDGALSVQDAQQLLQFLVNPSVNGLTFSDRFAAEVSNNGVLSAYDAGLIFRRSSGFMGNFPADLNGSGFGPEQSRFQDVATMNAATQNGNPVLTLLPPENPDGDEKGVRVQLSGFSEPVLSVELRLLFTSQVMDFEMISGTDSGFDELIYAAKTGQDTLHVVWTSNQFTDDTLLGTLSFTPTATGHAFITVTDVRINEYAGAVNGVGTSFFIENNPAVSTGNPSVLPQSIILHQNYPNPFNPETTISFSLPNASTVSLRIYNSTGRVIHVLADGVYSEGSHHIRFNASNLSSGVYYYHLVTEIGTITRKMLLIK